MTCHIPLSDFTNTFIRQLSSWSSHSTPLPAFGHLVGDVVSVGAREQMFRIATRWIVAAVTNNFSLRHLAICVLISKHMCPKLDATIGAKATIPTIGPECSRPRPTRIRAA